MKLRVEKALYGGDSLAHIPAGESDPSLVGKAVFVPHSLPGELVEAHITGSKPGFSTAEIDRVLESAAERVLPTCEYFPACGGCQYQHASGPYQLEMKLNILRDTLARAHLPALPARSGAIPSLHANPWGYRNRIRLHVHEVHTAASKSFALCYRERGSHRNLPITHCPIAAPLLERAIAAVSGMGSGAGSSSESEADLCGLCDEIEFFTNGEQDTLLVSLTKARFHGKRSQDRMFEQFSERLKTELPELAGIGLFSASLPSEDRQLLSHWGRRSLIYSVLGRNYQVSLGSFFQVNRFLILELLELVAGGRAGRLAWDLYAGVGLFAQALKFEQVIAVEASSFSAADLKRNLGKESSRAIQSSTLDFLRGESRRKAPPRPDLVLVDPPRAGLGPEIAGALARVAPAAIVYVSCDPATLARDLQTLLQSGYRLETMVLVDLFPQTFHVETVTVLARS